MKNFSKEFESGRSGPVQISVVIAWMNKYGLVIGDKCQIVPRMERDRGVAGYAAQQAFSVVYAAAEAIKEG